MVKHQKRGALPLLDVRTGHTTTTVIVALTGMINGSYGDMRTGSGDGDYVHVSRLKNGYWRVVHISKRESFQSDNTTRLAQFIMNRVE